MSKRIPKPLSAKDVQPISPDELSLDSTNPRLAGDEVVSDDEVELIRLLWEKKAVAELVESIAENGYWSHEEIFATREGGKLVVIEGNRRLAAVKLLLHPELANAAGINNIPKNNDRVRKTIERLPVIICTRFDVWQYLGFKHVNGPQDWDSIAKAEYIARVHDKYHVKLEEIARTIGDRHNTVRRLYQGLMVLKQAENTGMFDRDDIWNRRFAYSHLWTGLTYPNIQAFIGLSSEKSDKPNPVPKAKLEELGELCLWMYGSKSKGEPPLVRSQNPDLRKLEAALSSHNGIAALRNKFPLDAAVNASRGDKRLLREALVASQKWLRDCRGYVPNGYEGESDLLELAESIQTLGTTLYEEMARYETLAKKKSPTRKGK